MCIILDRNVDLILRKIIYQLSQDDLEGAYDTVNNNIQLLNTVEPFLADILLIRLSLILNRVDNINNIFSKLIDIINSYSQLDDKTKEVWTDLIFSIIIISFKQDLSEEQEEQLYDILISDISNEYYITLGLNYANNKDNIDIDSVIDAQNEVLYEYIRNMLNYYSKYRRD
jgi:predicted unusual protein kinase regulating ubiquinone biosynthesis (AarF/ABC1/UbiB family)